MFATKAGQTPSPKANLDFMLGQGISGTGILALDEYVNAVIECQVTKCYGSFVSWFNP
jgi:hypothetical protein